MLYETTVPHFIKMLHNLENVLDKGAKFAETKKIDMDVLLNSRLAPDQFPLGRQIQIACDTAKLAAFRLTEKTAPTHADTEKTYAEFQDRIKDTLKYLNSLSADDFKGAETKHITTPRWNGEWMTGAEFISHHALPNLYFHVTTAYSILRHNGVEIGKKDYLGAMPLKK